MPDVMRCLRPVGSSASATPRIAKLSASVPPLVKITSAGSAPIKAADGAPRVVDCRLCLLPIVMNTRRIAEKMLKGAHHGLGGQSIDRRRRVVIEIDAHVLNEC